MVRGLWILKLLPYRSTIVDVYSGYSSDVDSKLPEPFPPPPPQDILHLDTTPITPPSLVFIFTVHTAYALLQ